MGIKIQMIDLNQPPVSDDDDDADMDTQNLTGETSNHMAIVVASESPNLTEETSNDLALVPFAVENIEDYATFKSCHQCRRPKHVYGSCLTVGCRIMFCPPCLKFRYGEILEAVVANNNWLCPRCRGVCSCSYCREKIGLEPTGKLITLVKEFGCNNALEFLEKYWDCCNRSAETVRCERKKQVRKIGNAAREKKKQLERKIEYVLARGKMENNRIPLRVDQKLAILKKLEAETEQVFNDLHNALGMQSKTTQF
ncbi:unnamed protein product [Microthlaspi erraticum]|uniref:Zinc-finger domain-containing protein n=1 Tax=Microthlaspi erraticum TaxID=1685480 RepID=A0A6D2K239_9BRAS|nr:unnamed protein product [Microthlaspi erraticum]